MGTILDTIISFIIGALVILAILGLNTSLTQTSYDMTSTRPFLQASVYCSDSSLLHFLYLKSFCMNYP